MRSFLLFGSQADAQPWFNSGRARPLRLLLHAGSLMVALLWCAPGHAQANYDGVNLGGRTAMMGGAGVARGSDGATAFINPAGLARIPGESFSFQTVAVRLSGRHLSGQFDPSNTLGLARTKGDSLSVNILPNTFCLFLDGPPREASSPRSRHKYGVCAADTESDAFLLSSNVREGLLGAQEQGVSHTTRLKWARSTLALSWALQLAPATAIGVTARIDNSRLEDQTSVTSYAIDGMDARLYTLDHSRVTSSWDASVTVGLSHQLSKVATIGASLSSPSQHIYGHYQGTMAFSSAATGEQILVQDVGDFRYNQPTNLRLGVAFAWPIFNFELDASLFAPSGELATALFNRSVVVSESGVLGPRVQGREQLAEAARPIANIMLGMEAFVAPDFSIIAGAQTDFSALKNRSIRANSEGAANPADVMFRQRKSGVHASLGVVSYGAAGSLLLGLRGNYSRGELLAGDPGGGTPRLTPISQEEWGVGFVVSGQISFEAVRDTAIRAASPLRRIPEVLEEAGEADSAPSEGGSQ